MLSITPIYLLIDVSGSMSGAPLLAVKQGLKEYIADLRSKSANLSQIWVSVITFSSSAKLVSPLAPLSDFTVPELYAAGGTALGAALSLAAQCSKDDAERLAAMNIAYKEPIAKIITDGMPTDNFSLGAKAFNACRFSEVEVLALRPEIDEKIFAEIGAMVTFLPEITKETIDHGLKSEPTRNLVPSSGQFADLLKKIGAYPSEAEIDDFTTWLITKAWKEYNEEKQAAAVEAERRVRQTYIPLPPGTVGKPYASPKFELPDEIYAYDYEFIGLNEIGLKIAKDDFGFLSIQGMPTKSGLFDIAIVFKYPGWLPNHKLLKRELSITVNP